MLKLGNVNARSLLAALCLSCAGCAAQLCHLPDDCAYAFRHTQLGWELCDICHHCPLDGFRCGGSIGCGDPPGCGAGIDCGCGVDGGEETVWMDEPRPRPARPCARIAPGPPPIPYEAPLPPKFLPLPTRPVFSNVNQNAPTMERGPLEVGFGHELAFP